MSTTGAVTRAAKSSTGSGSFHPYRRHRLELAREGLRPRPHHGLGSQAQGPERLPRRLLADDLEEGVPADASVDGREGQAIRRWIDRPRRVDRVPETVGLEVHFPPDLPRHVVSVGERAGGTASRQRRQESILHGRERDPLARTHALDRSQGGRRRTRDTSEFDTATARSA